MRVIKDTTFEVGHKVWQVRPPRPSLTVVIKATFTLVPDATAELAEEQQPVTGDAFWDDDPEQSVRVDGDLAILKTKGECFLAGTCHPPKAPTTVSAVSFRVGQVSKRLAVFGDRRWQKGVVSALPTQPLPFQSMPLRWERSFGGEGFSANPVGQGLGERLPNLEDPSHLVSSPSSRPRPAGFFPIPIGWKNRMKKTGSYGDEWLKTRWPYLPKDFDWSFYNAAPEDQWIEGYWRGDEDIELVNLHPARANWVSRLPGLRPRCFLVMDEDPFREVSLHLDTIAVDADAETVSCVWRGLAEVRTEKLTEVEQLFVFHEPVETPASAEDCRARYEQKLAALEKEKQESEPEAPDSALPGIPPEIAAQLAAVGLAVEAVSTEDAAEPASNPSDAKASPEPTATDTEADEEEPPPVEAVPREEIEHKLEAKEPLAGEDLIDADLSGLCFDGVDLTGTLLAGANLENASFEEAVLDGAVLEGARLSGAEFSRASLKEADLTGATGEGVIFDGAVLEGTLFENSALPKARFVEAGLDHANFRGAKLEDADFSKAKLDGADLTGAQVPRGRFQEASLVDARLESANAADACFDSANLEKLRAAEAADFSRASLKHAKADGSRWGTSKLDEANFSFSTLARADFGEASLVKAVLVGCQLVKARFGEARLWGASLVQANAMEADFESADLADADLRGANLFGCEFWKAKLERTRLELANLNRTKLSGGK